MIKQITFTIFWLLCYLAPSFSATHEDKNAMPKYDLSCAGTGVEGTYLATVSVYLPKVAKTDDVLRKATVHGVIFKGINGSQGCSAQRPLASDPSIEQEKADFFNDFFKDGGTYLKYVTVIEGSLHVTKTGKKEYRITATVSIQKDLLRNHLEQEKVITGFSDIF